MASRPLRAVPGQPLRALGLIRVSKERDGMVAPEVQRAAIVQHADRHGYDVVGWVEGLDESGSRARSAWWPRLEQAVTAVEAGEYDVIVAWKFSRAARDRRRWAVALDRVEVAGGRLESATEGVDVTTSTGRLTRGVLAEFNAFEAERIGEVWKEVHARRVASGRPANGKPRFGYRYDPDRKIHVPDPTTGPVLAELYRRYVAGESVYALVRWLNAHGWRTTAGGHWSERGLRRVLDTGFAAGFFTAAGTRHDGVHEPLIDRDLWQAYLDARADRRSRPARTERSPYLLSGLVRCARCGGSMVAGQFGHAHAPKYRCKAGKEQGPEVCTGGYVMASFLEAAVVDWLRGLADDVDQAAAAHRATEAKAVRVKGDVRRIAAEVDRLEDALTRLALQHAQRPMPDQVYARAQDELVSQLATLRATLDDAAREERGATVDVAAAAAGLLEGWEERPVEHRRVVLRSLVARVEVRTGRPRATVRVVPAWEA